MTHLKPLILIVGLTLAVLLPTSSAQLTECTTALNSNGCECEENIDRPEYTFTCSRVRMNEVPAITPNVRSLSLFRLNLESKSLSNGTLQQAMSLLQIVDINSCDLNMIETGAFSGLSVLENLDLGSNALRLIPNGVFRDLISLNTLRLRDNSIEMLTSDSFRGLANLQTLDLSLNTIKSLPPDTFKYLTNLRHLILEESFSGITQLPAGLFTSLPLIESTELQNNDLQIIQSDIFAENSRLTSIDLSKNKLMWLEAETFENLTGLRTIILTQNNVFMCDSRMYSFRLWLDTIPIRPADSGKCIYPEHLRGLDVTSIPNNQFVDITTTTQPTATTSAELITTTATEQLLSTKAAAVNKPDKSDNNEFILIIVCSVIGALLLIILNIFIVCLVKRIQQRKRTKKIKYIIKPDNPYQPEEYGIVNKVIKPPVVDGFGSGFIVNGNCGFYHAGSKSKLYSDSEISEPPAVPPKQDDVSRYSPTKQQSIYSIAHGDGQYGSVFDIPHHQHREITSQHDSALGTPHKDYTGPYPYNMSPHHNNSVTTPTRRYLTPTFPGEHYYQVQQEYYEADNCLSRRQHSDEFVPSVEVNCKVSTGSGDSGVDSYSPGLHSFSVASHGLAQDSDSPMNKKIRTETYV